MNEQYRELHPGDPLPELYWLQVTGCALVSDFGVTPDSSLVVSDRALSTIQSLQLDERLVYGAEKPPTPDQISADLWARAKFIAGGHH
jgi:hypothetical protein